jgi:rhizosphere induced protein
MMTYSISMQNDLPQTWTFGVFQTYPNTAGIDSVAWKQQVLASTEKGSVSWQPSSNACIASYSQIKGIGVYSSDQIIPAQPGSAWKVVLQNGHQQLQQDTSTPTGPDQILISNESGQIANPGIGMSGIATAYMKELYSGVDVIFNLPSTYWVALFRQVAAGDAISDLSSTTPLLISFPGGLYSADVQAYLDGGAVLMSVQYTQMIASSVELLEAL